MRGFRYIPADTLELDAGRCNGCRTCESVCPHAVLAVDDGTARIVDRGACMECGACALNCAQGALTVRQGVGCASAIVASWFGRGDDVTCGDTGGASGCC